MGNASSSSLKPAGSSLTSSVLNSSDEAADSQRHPPGASAAVQNSSTMIIDCDPCSTTGDCVEAVGYCTQCKEYYCQPCYRAHSRSKATSNHTLLNQSTMPARTMSGPTPGVTNTSSCINTASDSYYNSQFLDEFYFVRDINVMHKKEKNNCLITAIIAISDHELVVNDRSNKSMKKIDIASGAINEFMDFKTAPFCGTLLPTGEIAVTFPEEQVIRILFTTGGLTVRKLLRMSGLCTAIEYCNGSLYVSYQSPAQFQIITLTGAVKKTITTHPPVILPASMVVQPDESKMFVTDLKQNAILCIDMNGTILASYQDKGLVNPHDITRAPSGLLYVCNTSQNVVYHMDDNFSEATVVLGTSDGVLVPASMCFCSGRRSFYIISGYFNHPKYCNVIKEFNYT